MKLRFFFYSLSWLQNKIAKINPTEFRWLNQDCEFPPELLEPSAPLGHHGVVEPLCSGLLMLAGIKSSGDDKAFKFWKKKKKKLPKGWGKAVEKPGRNLSYLSLPCSHLGQILTRSRGWEWWMNGSSSITMLFKVPAFFPLNRLK